MKQKIDIEYRIAWLFITLGLQFLVAGFLIFCMNYSRGIRVIPLGMAIIGIFFVVIGFIIQREYVITDSDVLSSIYSTRNNFCSNCGTPVLPEDNFCTHCGKQI
jgi:uncharacterized membrane protein